MIENERPPCNCAIANDSEHERVAIGAHAEDCALFRWWWAQAVELTCNRSGCKRVELVDPSHPDYARFKSMTEPRRAGCSQCAIAAFTF